MRPTALLCIAALLGLGCRDAAESEGPLLVHCTASLTTVMEEICREYADAEGSAVADINSASSLLLRRQIEAGMPGDVFISASDIHMDALERSGRVDPGSRTELLRNRMALLVRVESGIRELEDLVSEDVSVGLAHEGVPAGDYARHLLRSAGLWESVSPSVLSFPHEPAVLRSLERAVISAAFVYGSSAASIRDDGIHEVRIAPALQPEIRYPGAVLSKSGQPSRARQFLEFLRKPRAQEILAKHGFIPVVRS